MSDSNHPQYWQLWDRGIAPLAQHIAVSLRLTAAVLTKFFPGAQLPEILKEVLNGEPEAHRYVLRQRRKRPFCERFLKSLGVQLPELLKKRLR